MPKGKSDSKTFLVDVAPVISTAAQGSLSYFSTNRLLPGMLVKVPLRSSFQLAVVLRSRDVKSAKSLIRRAGFILRKIRKSDILDSSISMEVLRAVDCAANYYGTSIGAILSAILPKIIVTAPTTFLRNIPVSKKKKPSEHLKEPVLLQMEADERFGQYRALVRQCFARGASVMFIVPTHLDCAKALKELSRGIEEFVYVWSLNGKKDAIKKSWDAALSNTHPILFITTPAGIIFPRRDMDTIILERENSRAYRTLTRPFIHWRNFIEILSKESGKQLILGDSVLSIETLWKEKSGEYGENSLIRWRLQAAPATLIDAKSKQNQIGRFEIISPELKELIQKAMDENEGIFLFGARKGLAPTTVCGDCGTVLPCLNCGAPVVLHRHNEATVYVCHACGIRRESATPCGYCRSWKLVPLGIGTEQIAKAVKELFPKENIYILDKDHAKTDRQADLIAERFKETKGILIGTELAFYHLDQVSYSGLVSADALFSIPDFGINEKIFYIVSRLREMTKIESIIQTRNIGKQILSWAAQGNIIDFYQNEIEERQALLYPPFSIFIKITAPGKDAQQELSRWKERLNRFHPDILKDSIIIRLPQQSWPDPELSYELALLPPSFSIKVDPESIL